jgi:hypothetical protein
MSRHLLMESILGHMALLAEQHPEKAASPVARRAKRYVRLSLQPGAAVDAAARAAGVAPAKTPLRRAA